MKVPQFGIPDDQFLFTVPRKGLITKSEIRVLSLSKLNLGPGQVLWDIGAGSGSVGIEAARLVADLTVVAIEKDKEDYDCLQKNIETFGVARRFQTIHGKAPELLPSSPRPDRIFIGGSGGKMAPLLDHARTVLPSDGIIVLNLATFENIAEALSWARAAKIEPDLCQVQIGRGKPLIGLHRIEALNPVWIMTLDLSSISGEKEPERVR
ncbi:MAG: precorrin-6Y C5,15-methyltransferase (decarboxylating) subunit CbiT [Leptospirales bacterium]